VKIPTQALNIRTVRLSCPFHCSPCPLIIIRIAIVITIIDANAAIALLSELTFHSSVVQFFELLVILLKVFPSKLI
jgi:hypothetical protein